ncbi:MAG: cupin domain-containing protein [Alphaproteobacteria bacterium]
MKATDSRTDALTIVRGRFPAPVDPSAVARDWRGRGYSCTSFADPPGQEWNGFVHRTNELVTVVAGCLRVEVGAAAAELGPGDELFIPSGAVHSVHNADRGTTRWLFGYD